MKMRFSKIKFLRNAPSGIKRRLMGRIEILEGAEVIFDGSLGKDGYILRNLRDGRKHFFYPVCKNWCEEFEK